ncbi:MAG TPA: alpha/beta fold hydrolase, partial [Planctomycetes bacterium]|nr:alpha/beta fold hydrolase [Planctomycetota bacterium]
GSPGSKRDFHALAEHLRQTRRVLIPDLPGFGDSERDVADYSIRSHADYVLQLLDALHIERAHVLGFSMGGGVALELAGEVPGRVASLTLLSSIGVQELELMGDWHLNHAIHFLQWVALVAVRDLVPHFGLFDGSVLSVAYARNFLDTDQRPLRARLRALAMPVLILHGRDDVLVPYAAAEEHHRLVPQSELVTLQGNHFLVFRRPDEVATPILGFLEDVEAGRARTRADASAERIAAAAKRFDPRDVPPVSGFALVVFCVLAALSTFVSEDLTCIAVGAMVGDGRIPFLAGVLACLVGIYVGDMLLFLAGRVLGRRALRIWPLNRMLTEERVASSSRWLSDRGAIVILSSRFLPGARLPTYFAAGVLRTGFWRFNLWFLGAAALWTPLVVWGSSRVGGALGDRFVFLREHVGLGFVLTLLVLWVCVRGALALVTARGRALVRGRFLRIVRWEYWPRWVVYAPVALAVAWHGLRRGRPFAFTAVNPAIPLGGLIGESKSAILAGLCEGRGAAHMPRTLVVDGGGLDRVSAARRSERVDAFRARLARPFPLVVKPDVGQRGDGVRIVRSERELDEALEKTQGHALVQEYCGGEEFGIFHARLPSEPRGRVLSVARKRPRFVVGDGTRSLERLILEDSRLVPQARLFLDRFAERLDEVPSDGERIALGELGTHCRGAVFLEGADLLTRELEEEVAQVAAGYSGFFLGRFDLKAPSGEALSRGEFQILELNGLTSEPAHIYDPSYGPLTGMRALVQTWRLAIDIGSENARAGARVSGPVEVLGALWRYRRRSAVEPLGPEGWFELPPLEEDG